MHLTPLDAVSSAIEVVERRHKNGPSPGIPTCLWLEVTYPPESPSGYAYCSLPVEPPLQIPPGVGGGRLRSIIVSASKWVNGTVLRYYFFDRDTDGEWVVFPDGSKEFCRWTSDNAHHDIVRGAFQAWKDIGIGLEFLEVDRREEAEVRIGFMQGDGHWSGLGRNVLSYGTDKRTMNFGQNLVAQKNADIPIHEVGHTLGLPHEHQNPNAGMVWDEERVYAALAEPPNRWDREKTHWNIIRKIAPDTVQGSSWDPDSIMHYPFEAGLILKPDRYRTEPLQPAGGLSHRDITWVRSFYPPMDDVAPLELVPFQSQTLAIGAGEQRDFIVRPPATKKYKFATFGEGDTVLVLFEDVDGALRFLAGDDDSGEERNSGFEVKLFSQRRYVLRIRLNFATAGEVAAMMW